MANRQDFALEKMDERFRKNAFRYSVVCMIIVLLLTLCANSIISDSDVDFDFELFETVAIDPLILEEGHEKAYGSDVKVGVAGYSVCGENVCVDIFGKNDTDSEVPVSSGIFVLAAFNKSSSDPRSHYYAENWDDVRIPPNSEFSCQLKFDTGDAESLLNGEYILTLSAFRNVMDRETVEIIINK